jgi:predicted O-methyltransferase YrrM
MRDFVVAHGPKRAVDLVRRGRQRRRQNAIVKIDRNHAGLVGALVSALKPATVLELGFGGGESATAILSALKYNRVPFEYTLVDNWMDFDGKRPAITRSPRFRAIDFVTSDEEAFVKGCGRTFDFVFSDADHFRAQQWFQEVYDDLLRPGGALLYHDVMNPHFVNLREIYERVADRGYRHALFDRSTRDDEQCERGLLVIFKD